LRQEPPPRNGDAKTMGSIGIRWLKNAPRWPYWIPATIALILVGPAYEDDGMRSAGLYACLVLLSIVQSIRPTMLGWLILFAPFFAYELAVELSRGREPLSEWLLFVVLGFVPTLAMWIGRPWRFERT